MTFDKMVRLIFEQVYQDRLDQTDYVNPTTTEWKKLIKLSNRNSGYRETMVWNFKTDQWATTTDLYVTHEQLRSDIMEFPKTDVIYFYSNPQKRRMSLQSDTSIKDLKDALYNSKYYNNYLKPMGWNFTTYGKSIKLDK